MVTVLLIEWSHINKTFYPGVIPKDREPTAIPTKYYTTLHGSLRHHIAHSESDSANTSTWKDSTEKQSSSSSVDYIF